MKGFPLGTLLAGLLVFSTTVRADRPWSEIRGRNVIVYGQQSSRTLRDTAIQIEQFRSVLGRLIGSASQPQSLPTEVYLFDNARAMEDYVPLYQGRPAPLAGYCHCGAPDEISVILASLSNYAESSAIVYHEYTHLLMRNAVRDLPVWLNEGLAEYFSTFTLRENGREAQIGAPIPRHVEALREQFVPLAELVAVDRSSALYNERTRRSIFYAESWALTHYLLHGRPGGAETLNAILAGYASGEDGATALTHATGVPLKDLDGELRRYVSRPVFAAATVTLSSRIEMEQPSAARTLAPADAEARLAEIQLRVDRVDQATRRIEAAAAAAPDVAQTQLVLAKLRLRQQRNADAVPLLRKASTLAPDDFAAQYLYALTLLRGDGDLSSTTWPTDRAREARELLTRAVAIRPESAAALAWLGYADEQAGAHLDEARAVTKKAMTLAPGRVDYARQLEDIEADLASRERRAAPTTAVEPPRQPPDLREVTYRLRETRPGEHRVFGELIEIACASEGVRFRLRADGREIAAGAKRMEDVELTAFGTSNGQTVRCGARTPADKVYLTRAADGTVVAVEFMPGGYVP